MEEKGVMKPTEIKAGSDIKKTLSLPEHRNQVASYGAALVFKCY